MNELPSNLVIEKQRVIIDELKEKINLPLDNLDKLSNEELKKVVDNAIFQVFSKKIQIAFFFVFYPIFRS